jgi:DNA modification methylase
MIHAGDALTVLKTMESESVQCCITSPPYYGLRDYGVDGQIGLEKTPEEYLATMTAIFHEVKRVLRDDGTLWLNMGDSYAAGKSGRDDSGGNGKFGGPRIEISQRKAPNGFKPKDLMMMPSRLAMALQADGWYLRSMMPWVKRNSMPESATDRPSSAVEYMFLLSKSQKYYYDAEAVRVPNNDLDTKPRHFRKTGDGETLRNDTGNPYQPRSGRNRRNSDSFFESWQGLYEEDDEPLALIVNPQPFSGAHFATFPEKLIIPCIKAGTSEKGQCATCGSPWVREIIHKANYEKREPAYAPNSGPSKVDSSGWKPPTITDNGWSPACSCNAEVVPQIVLDIFMGSGTVAVVAEKLGRRWTGIELNPEYIKLAEKRIGLRMPL